MEIIELVKAIILGMVEGLTEFAPVSSTGHMVIVDDLWLKSKEVLGSDDVANTFKVVIQLGSILAVVVVFRNRFIDLLGLGKKTPEASNGEGRLKLTQVIVGLIPAGILGLLFDDYIDENLFTIETVLIGLLIGSVLMIFADLFAPKKPRVTTVDQITYRQALTVGLVQCLSLWPGFSRSGATMSGGVLTGMSHRAAADFTFIMAVPIMAGASGVSLLSNWQYFTMDVLPFFIVGFISAFLFALITIKFFLRIIDRIKLIPFAIYRIVLVAVLYLIYF
ncbi:undecaprenyl-diphosphate phosphatase [Virgibacillus necropolis]|uniref:Undecaprenyl-diphosphatase n=1 Tax=Virgibacillus necropolis TaxID=163877 RepID=A0A221MAY3_9BACI|nr:undecaprenyl-diphosphate phosphatase [Virgibacillus necropolis]ASN04801.1 undecaprenyl-diphosphatase [Virgibacillus necropolis]